jgi:hypothetical protein
MSTMAMRRHARATSNIHGLSVFFCDAGKEAAGPVGGRKGAPSSSSDEFRGGGAEWAMIAGTYGEGAEATRTRSTRLHERVELIGIRE